MAEILASLARHDEPYLRQVLYSLHFCHPAIREVELCNGGVRVCFDDAAAPDDIHPRINRLLSRYAGLSDEFEPKTLFRVESLSGRDPLPDPFPEIVRRGWVVPVFQGQVVLRSLALDLLEFFDAESLRLIAKPMGASPEYYPSGISCEALAKTAHFSSFPEHIQFVCHLTPDVAIIDAFTQSYRANEDIARAARDADGAFQSPAVVMNPSVCYHCYNALASTVIAPPGIAVTARSRCQRFESGNHETMVRLMDFTMREVIFLGKPEFVLDTRADTVRRVEEMMRRWEIDSFLESSNDPFFTDDYATKAAFQRHQDLKYELRAALPYRDGSSLAIASSNYHSITFGKAFDIRVGKRPACTGCLGFGLERMVFAVFAQHGLEPEAWPAGLKDDFAAWRHAEGGKS